MKIFWDSGIFFIKPILRFEHFLIYGGSWRWDKWWEFFEVKEKYSSVQVLYPSSKAHRVTTLGHPYQMRRRGEGWNITVQPCLVTGLAPAWWNGADQPLHYVTVHFHAMHWTPIPVVLRLRPSLFCVLVEPAKKQKAVYVDKLFYTWSSPPQPNGDVVKSFLLYPIVLFNRFWWPVSDTRKVSSPTLNLSVEA